MLYRAVHLKKVAGNRTILDIKSLAIKAGRIYGLLGANGAGKTTLLNILGFLESPTSGSMEFADRPVRFTSNALQQLRREVVMVDQHPVLFTTSVYKNIEFGLKIRNVASKQRERIIDQVLEMVGLAEFKREPGQELSGGETQRIALARALALSPRVLLCDEPTSSVDVENQAAIVAILKEINTTLGISIIFTTQTSVNQTPVTWKRIYDELPFLSVCCQEKLHVCTGKINRTVHLMATNVVNPLTCKSLPVVQQRGIKPVDIPPPVYRSLVPRLPAGVAHLLR